MVRPQTERSSLIDKSEVKTVRHGLTPRRPELAELRDQEIERMTRFALKAILKDVPPPCLPPRVKRRLESFDASTLRRILYLCRRCQRNQQQLIPVRRRAAG